MKAPVISVILPVYNASAFVNEAIDSILAQDFTDFELIIADDGSTDDSLQKVQAYTDKRIRVLVNSGNQGLITTLNTCMKECRGSFIARMDADDICDPRRFSAQLAAFENLPAVGIVSSLMGLIGEPGRVVKHRFLEPREVKAALPYTNPIVHPAVMFRASMLPKRDLYNKEFLHAEDYGLWMELIRDMEFKVIPLPLVSHRSHHAQVSVTHYEQQKKSVSKAHALLCTYLGITPTEAELQLQLSLFLEQFSPEAGYIDRAETWLTRLTDANRKAGILPVTEFENVTGEWWFRLNQYLAARGTSSLKRYRQSPLAKMYTPPLASTAKLFARSIVTGKRTHSK